MKGDYWLYFNQVLDPKWCDYIVEYATDAYTPKDAVIGFDDAKQDNTYRKSEVRWLDARVEKAITEEIWHYANQVNRDSFDLDLRYVNEIQFTKYEINQQIVHTCQPSVRRRGIACLTQEAAQEPAGFPIFLIAARYFSG